MMKHSVSVRPAAVAVLYLAAFATALRMETAVARQSGASAFPLPAGQTFTNAGRQLVSVSPDGTTVVYVANTQLFLHRIGEPRATPVAGTLVAAGIVNPVFSPDGQSIAYWSADDQMVKRIPIGGGTPTSLYQSVNPFGLSWSADGRILAGQGPAGILSGSDKGGAAETIVTVQSNEVATTPHMLSGGETLLFTLVTTPVNWDNGTIVAQSLKSGERRVLVQGGRDPRYLASGHLVYARGSDILAVRFDPQRLEVNGTPVTVLRNVRGAGNGSSHFSFSSAGTLSYLEIPAPITELQLAMVDLAGSVKPIGKVPASTFAPRASPDGKQLTFNLQGLEEAIYIYDIASGNMRQLVGRGNRGPLWTPDGTRIVYISGDATEALYWQKADGTQREELVPIARAPESWLAATQTLSFITLKAGATPQSLDYDIWTYSFRDKTAAPLIANPGSAQHSSRFSPDGRWIAYVSNETGTHEVFVQPYPVTGAKYQVTQGGGLHPVWSPDGTRLYFDIGTTLYASDVKAGAGFQAGPPVALPITGFIAGGVNTRRQYDMMPDGKQFVMMLLPPQLQQQMTLQIVPNWGDRVRAAVK